MNEIFFIVLNMSLTASYVIILVILLRLLLKKAPKFISYALWSVVAFRLIIPFSFEGIFSLLPRNTNATIISPAIIFEESPQITSGIGMVDSFVNGSLPVPVTGNSVNPLQILAAVGIAIWVLGIIALLTYSLVSILCLQKQLKNAELREKNIYEAENLQTPFVLGFIRPKIYLPARLTESERAYILLHEQTHIQRKDHIIKILSFIILAIHWFNPLVWLAFSLMSKDMELSCDERVLKTINKDIKKAYANSLLALASGRQILSGSPLAFGEGNVTGRIKNVLNYQKPKFWLVVLAIILAVMVTIGLATNPIASKDDLSMLNVKNLAKTAYQKDELVISTAPGKNAGFNVSAKAIAEYLDSVKWVEKKMDSPLELSADLQIEWNEDQELRFYESEPLLAMVLMNDQWRYYRIGQDDYKKILSIIEKAYQSKDSAVDLTFADNLWKARTQYLGDNSAIGGLLSLLPVPNGLQYDHFELKTSEHPYQLEIFYNASSNTLTEYDAEPEKANPLRKNALLLLALVDNADSIKATLTDGKGSVSFNNGRDWADATLGEDARNYAASPAKLQKLLGFNLPTTNLEDNQGKTTKSYNIISDYMKQEAIAAFSPYYELLDFQISNYEEKVVDGIVEATFFYKLIEKNYDKDPDTVGYIKDAKTSGNKNYQQMYDEYLQPREANFDLKVAIKQDNTITLYANISPNGTQWEETKMTDYILNK